ncbi:protein kinase family protein [Nocardioides cavernaquae]|nr:protein kinase family protein [Nocardioides cavernaquae]
MPAMRPGDVLANRYRLVVLLHERSGGRFWKAWDNVLARFVALHLIQVDDDRSPLLQDAARRSAGVHDPHLLRVLDANTLDDLCYVVNEWGEGTSLNNMVAEEPLPPLRAAWIAAETAAMVAAGHQAGVAHGRLVPENVLLDTDGAVKVIGFAVDAALHGLPPERKGADLVDIGGILYAALTGRWAGVSDSGVPAAPLEHGRPLRARQVRAGVPRTLDAICEDLLGGRGRLTSMDAVVDALLAYIGDPTVVAQAEGERVRSGRSGRSVEDTDATDQIPAVTAPVLASPEAAADTPPAPAVDDGPPTQLAPMVADEQHTQAGAPAFLDDVDEDNWHAPSGIKPPPPPPFEEPPERPLFAPDPPEGRLRRLPPATGAEAGYWPFAESSGPHTPIPVDVEDPDPTPGRNWLRLAGVLMAILLVVVVVIFLMNRGGERTPDGNDPSSATPSGSVLTGVAASDFDPFGDPPNEHPEDVALTVDGKPDTAWETTTYKQDFGPGGLKPGVGLVLDLGSSRSVNSVVVSVNGDPTAIELRTAGDVRPSGTGEASLSGLDVAARATSSGGKLTLTPESTVTTRYLLLWITSLPTVGGEFRAAVSEVEVRG